MRSVARSTGKHLLQPICRTNLGGHLSAEVESSGTDAPIVDLRPFHKMLKSQRGRFAGRFDETRTLR